MSYWLECLEVSFEEHGVKATREQLELVAEEVEIAFDNYGMYSGREVASANLHANLENERKREIKRIEEENEREIKELECSHNNTVERLNRIIIDVKRANEDLERENRI